MSSSPQDVLNLVELALTEFDSVPLQATVRRAIRIANLMGDSRTALRLAYELTPTAGDPASNAADSRRFLVDAESWGKPDSQAEAAVSAYFGDRKMKDSDLIDSITLADLEFWLAHYDRQDINELTGAQFETALGNRMRQSQYVELARSRTFAALCGWERQLTFASRNAEIISQHQHRVDALLASTAPDVVGQFNAVFRRLQGSIDATETQESLSQAVTTCRRILKGVVDAIHPVDPTRPLTDDGHALTDDKYKNRLFKFLKDSVESESFSDALTSAATSLFERFSAVDTLASKGVHSVVALEEAEFCAANTYLLAGEILRLHTSATS